MYNIRVHIIHGVIIRYSIHMHICMVMHLHIMTTTQMRTHTTPPISRIYDDGEDNDDAHAYEKLRTVCIWRRHEYEYKYESVDEYACNDEYAYTYEDGYEHEDAYAYED